MQRDNPTSERSWRNRLAVLRRSGFYDPLALLTAVPVSIVVVVGACLSIQSQRLLRQDRAWVEHSYRVINATDSVLLRLADAETGQRGFIITGDDEFLAPYTSASRTGVPEAIDELSDLTSDNSEERRRLDLLRLLATRKLQELAATIDVRRTAGPEGAFQLVKARTGKDTMDAIRTVAADIQSTESTLLAARATAVHNDETRYLRIAVATTLVSTLLRIGIAILRRRAR